MANSIKSFRTTCPYMFNATTLPPFSAFVLQAWMDEYKEQYYSKRPDIKRRSYGDISDRLAIREKLKCKSFKWYLENVYPELPLPNENLYHGGSVSSHERGYNSVQS